MHLILITGHYVLCLFCTNYRFKRLKSEQNCVNCAVIKLSKNKQNKTKQSKAKQNKNGAVFNSYGFTDNFFDNTLLGAITYAL